MSSRSRGEKLALAAALAIGLTGPLAHAQVSHFVFRVDLESGVSTKLAENETVYRAPPAKARSTGWWRPSPGGRKPEISLDLLGRKGLHMMGGSGGTLVVAADGQEHLRLPNPEKSGALVWYVLEGDLLVLAWRTSNGKAHEQALSGDEHLTGVDLARGRVRWRRVSAEETQSARAAGDGRILVVGQMTLQAVDAASGAVVWTLPRATNDRASLPVPQLCALPRGQWMIATTEMLAVDASGGVAWRQPPGPGIAHWCLTTGERILVAWHPTARTSHAESVLAGVDASSGRIAWQKTLDEWPGQPMAVGPNEVAIWSSSGLSRLDPADGRIVWKLGGVAPTGVERLPDGDWFLAAADCTRVDARDGSVRWKLGEPCFRYGEDLLLTASFTNQGMKQATISLRRWTFADRKLLRTDVIQRYGHFFEEVHASVRDAYGGLAFVESEWIAYE